ncbi:hypothetical protein PIB30_050153, partial [Stylosanthes scabra]|nr:hypothetical protein [Stylosanthes scabra]
MLYGLWPILAWPMPKGDAFAPYRRLLPTVKEHGVYRRLSNRTVGNIMAKLEEKLALRTDGSTV